MGILDQLVEQRILDANERGEFDGLPGAGKPLEIDDDLLVPETVRVSYRVLRNAGLVPPEVDQRRELAQLESDAAQLPPGDRRIRAMRRMQVLRIALAESRGTGGGRALGEPQYFAKIMARLGSAS